MTIRLAVGCMYDAVGTAQGSHSLDLLCLPRACVCVRLLAACLLVESASSATAQKPSSQMPGACRGGVSADSFMCQATVWVTCVS